MTCRVIRVLVSVQQGSRGLSLFYAEVSRDEDGRLKGIEVQRLKDKLGTRQMPTAELLLDGLPAHRVSCSSKFNHSYGKLWKCFFFHIKDRVTLHFVCYIVKKNFVTKFFQVKKCLSITINYLKQHCGRLNTTTFNTIFHFLIDNLPLLFLVRFV